jgi:2-(1,2-epoxy-1,2-dihydrophenyl)acetyl-CoA isomerase
MTDPTTSVSTPGRVEPVDYTVDDGLATITLQRPESRNALDTVTKEALRAAVDEAAGDAGVRAVLLTGSGQAFCVGQDLHEHVRRLADLTLDEVWSTVEEHYAPLAMALATMPKPVVAGVNGVAAGAGASLAFACDLRVLSDQAGFNLAFAGVGLSCDTGASWTLPRLVGPAKAIELLYYPRTIGSAESLELGLATKVTSAGEFETEVGALAHKLASGPTVSYGAIRRSVEFSAGHSFAESLGFEASMMTLTGSTEDHRNAVSAFVAKERPVYMGR